jgi:predicted Zn-dependent protease
MTAFVRNQMYYVSDLSEIYACEGVGLRNYAYSILDIDEFDDEYDHDVTYAAIMHEFGHVMGCGHCGNECVMTYGSQYPDLFADDVFCASCQAIINRYK